MNLLSQLGQLAKKYDVHVQSHIAETADQVAFVHCLYPSIGNGRDVAIFRETGLLTNKAVFAHGVYLTDNEIDEMVASGSAVVSCPVANFLFSKGITAIEHFRRRGLNVGLGTDVGGAYSSSMLPVVRATVFANRTMDFVSFDRSNATLPFFPEHKDPVIDFKFAFYLATLGGAQTLNIDSQTGSFEVGKQFDALLIDCNKESQAFDYWKEDEMDIIFEKWVNAGDDRNIIEVWVQGIKVLCA
jgi:guanine deaminase